MLEGKVIKNFNDTKNKLKKYTAGKDIFRADDKRYNDLYNKGFVEKGKEVKEKKDTK